MSHGETIQPWFTLWLAHNEVGVTYDASDDRLPKTIVTGTDYDCPVVDTYGDGETETHGVEAKTILGTKITISARPMYNIGIDGVYSGCTRNGDFCSQDCFGLNTMRFRFSITV